MRAPRLLLPILLLAGVGCASSPEDRLIGIWSYDRDHSTLPDVPSLPIPGMQDRLERIRDAFQNVKLKVLSDHTFVFAGTGVLEGTWTYQSGALELKPKGEVRSFLFGNKPLKAKVGSDFDSLSVTQNTPLGDVVLRLRKTG